MKCLICETEYRIEPFIPKNKDGTNKFEKNEWFFAYCSCECGEFIIERKDIESRDNLEYKQDIEPEQEQEQIEEL